MILVGTGHRPDKLGGYCTSVELKLELFALQLLRFLRPARVISGMALGWDQALAQAAFTLAIPFDVYIPFEGQDSRWPMHSRLHYQRLCAAARRVKIVCEGGFAAWKMQRRNEEMVDIGDHILALWNGSPGGTANCVDYARSSGKPIINEWAAWSALS